MTCSLAYCFFLCQFCKLLLGFLSLGKAHNSKTIQTSPLLPLPLLFFEMLVSYEHFSGGFILPQTFLFISSCFTGSLESINDWNFLFSFSTECHIFSNTDPTLGSPETWNIYIVYLNIPASRNGIPFINQADTASSETFQSGGVGSYLVKNIKPDLVAHIPKTYRKQCDW